MNDVRRYQLIGVAIGLAVAGVLWFVVGWQDAAMIARRWPH